MKLWPPSDLYVRAGNLLLFTSHQNEYDGPRYLYLLWKDFRTELGRVRWPFYEEERERRRQALHDRAVGRYVRETPEIQRAVEREARRMENRRDAPGHA